MPPTRTRRRKGPHPTCAAVRSITHVPLGCGEIWSLTSRKRFIWHPGPRCPGPGSPDRGPRSTLVITAIDVPSSRLQATPRTRRATRPFATSVAGSAASAGKNSFSRKCTAEAPMHANFAIECSRRIPNSPRIYQEFPPRRATSTRRQPISKRPNLRISNGCNSKKFNHILRNHFRYRNPIFTCESRVAKRGSDKAGAGLKIDVDHQSRSRLGNVPLNQPPRQ